MGQHCSKDFCGWNDKQNAEADLLMLTKKKVEPKSIIKKKIR